MRKLIPALVPVPSRSHTVPPAVVAELVDDSDGKSGSSFESAAMWGPVLAAILLDLADLLSFGPQGLFIGLIAGTTLGWRIAAASGLSSKGRLICAGLAAVYCILPLTELLPLATMVTTASRVMSGLSLLRRLRGVS